METKAPRVTTKKQECYKQRKERPQSPRAVTVRELMTRPVEVIPQGMSLRSAARLLVRARVTGAPVVDAEGRCVGILSASDFLHWAEQGAPSAEGDPALACLYQVKGRLLTGQEAVICKLAEGGCPWQRMRPTTGGRHTAACYLPGGVLANWHEATKELPRNAVRRYMTTDIVTVKPEVPMPQLAQMMVDAGIHRIIVVDDVNRPIGIVTSMDVLAAVARAGWGTDLAPSRASGPNNNRP